LGSAAIVSRVSDDASGRCALPAIKAKTATVLAGAAAVAAAISGFRAEHESVAQAHTLASRRQLYDLIAVMTLPAVSRKRRNRLRLRPADDPIEL
jgi:hypothetical protein